MFIVARTLAFASRRAVRKILAVRGIFKIAPGGKCLYWKLPIFPSPVFTYQLLALVTNFVRTGPLLLFLAVASTSPLFTKTYLVHTKSAEGPYDQLAPAAYLVYVLYYFCVWNLVYFFRCMKR